MHETGEQDRVGLRRVSIGWLAGLLALGLLAGPVAAKKAKHPAIPHQVYLSSELAAPPAGPEGIAPWEEEPVTITSSDLSFSTAAGAITCTAEVPARVHLNREYNYLPALLADEETSTAPCTGPISAETIQLSTRGWQVEFATSGEAPFCPSPFPYVVQCASFRTHGVTVSVGSLACAYETKRPLNGTFDPAPFGSESANPVEVAIAPAKFKLLMRERHAPAYEGCPRSGELSGHLQMQTASDGALEARVVESQKRGGALCSLNAIGERCTVTYVNPDEIEAREVRQVFMPQENPKLEGVLVRIPTAGECEGIPEAGTGTSLAPGSSCTLTLERIGNPTQEVKTTEVHFGILTVSLPGGAPAVSESDIQ